VSLEIEGGLKTMTRGGSIGTSTPVLRLRPALGLAAHNEIAEASELDDLSCD
jgi:hypothetical protein